MIRVTLTTANTPGAVAVVQLHGGGVVQVLAGLTGRSDWPIRQVCLCGMSGIDEGLAVLLSDRVAQLMPHGGPRVVQRLLEHLTTELGCEYDAAPDVAALYPEAGSRIEAEMLDAIARAASPAAVDLLAVQPRLWQELVERGEGVGLEERRGILERSRVLGQLLVPPTVVVAGPANVGKSTLTNALMGKAVSIVADLPGTTRDWVGGLVELSGVGDVQQAVAVNWLDTPGLRESDDAVEQRAIVLARGQIERAGVLIAMRDREQPWPDIESLGRVPDLFVVNKVDDAAPPEEGDGLSADRPLLISAGQDRNLDALQLAVIRRLGLDDLVEEPWAFTEQLRDWCGSGEGGWVE